MEDNNSSEKIRILDNRNWQELKGTMKRRLLQAF